MIRFPNAKINLGLRITEKRSDGYHNIETVFYPIGWSDILEIVPAEKKINRKSEIQFRSSGIKIAGGAAKNSCLKAYKVLQQNYSLPAVQVHLHKLIPAGAGLGGGSSDAAFTLMMLNEMFSLNIPDAKLESIAAGIGADCAFFIRNHPVFASGIGNIFEPVKLDLSPYWIVVVKPGVHINTTDAYKNIVPRKSKPSIPEILKMPIEEWKEHLVNDFEENIFRKEPVIRHVKEQLYASGALYASMSGSGSAVFGIFTHQANIESRFDGYRIWHQAGLPVST